MAELIVVLFFYFIPTIVGIKHPHHGGIFILNLFLGWTFVGWVIALVWAVVRKQEATQ